MSVAIPNSPVFSPAPLVCKGSPETFTLPPTSPLASSSAAVAPLRSVFQRAIKGGPGGSPLIDRITVEVLPLLPPAQRLSSVPGAGASAFRRKRPRQIDIPLAEAIGVFAPPRTDGMEEVEAANSRYSVYCRRGKKRLEMEDRYTATLDIDGDPKSAFFGVFDGHGGVKAAEFASENMAEIILDEVSSIDGKESCKVEDAIRMGFLRTDSKFLKKDIAGGASCVTALVRKGNIAVSNSGDCRAVICRAGKAEALTSDHRPSRDDERHRIENLGGYVDYCKGAWRLQGTLAVSRGIGDSNLKRWVTPEPETKIISIDAECEFLILASDGLWDKVSNQEAIDMARPICIRNANPSPSLACRKLVDLSASRGLMDDISVMIIQLQHFARWDSNCITQP